MKVAFVSTYLSMCGIATYSEDLALALAEQNHFPVVLAEHVDPTEIQLPRGDIPYECLWDRETIKTDLQVLLGKLHGLEPDVIHIQHEFGLFPGDRSMLEFIRRANDIAPVVITLHTVFLDPLLHSGFFRNLLSIGCGVIVHTTRALERLLDRPVPEPLATCRVIQHGTRKLDLAPAADHRPLAFISTGFMGLNKAPMESVEAFLKARAITGTECQYTIAGKWDNKLLEKVTGIVHDYGCDSEVVRILNGFQTFEVLDELYAKSDCCILNLLGPGSTASASGQSHLALAHGVPTIASAAPIYDDVVGGLRFRSGVELASMLTSVMRDPRVLTALRDSQITKWYRDSTLWDVVAKQTVELYQELIDERGA